MPQSRADGPAAEELTRFEADHVWIAQHREDLLPRYRGRWIAVREGQVIASDPDFEGLLGQLPDPSHAAIDYVTDEPLEMIL